MAEYIERYTLAKNLCKAICGRDAGLCVAEPKDCRQKGMLAVFDTPAADVALVVHGHLKNVDIDEAYCEIGYCSVCGCWNPLPANFCRGCGSKMDKEASNGLDTPRHQHPGGAGRSVPGASPRRVYCSPAAAEGRKQDRDFH